jgi:MarR family transcriptional regulator for hemolysin
VPIPAEEPIGLAVTRSAKALSRAFDDALAAAGGSLPVWLVLVSVKSQDHPAQRRLAESVGIEGPTLTHHLDRMEAAGLVTRRRDPTNRRAHLVGLTDEGEAAFTRLLAVVIEFDRRLRAGTSDRDLATLRRVLDHLVANAATNTEKDVPT